MTFCRSLSAVFVSTCWLFVSVAGDVATNATNTAPEAAVTNSSKVNSTLGGGVTHQVHHWSGVDRSMIERGLYVLLGFTTIGVLYFLIRAVRLKKPLQRKKYGLLSNYDDSVEMEAVESDEDDTLYEARSLRR